MTKPCGDPWDFIPFAFALWQETLSEEPYLEYPFEIWAYRCSRCGEDHFAVISDAALIRKARERLKQITDGGAAIPIKPQEHNSSVGLDHLLTVLPEPPSVEHTPRLPSDRCHETRLPEREDTLMPKNHE